jgi:signal transduction histidine kinase
MGVPLKSDSEVAGVIGLGRIRSTPPFSPEQIDSMSRFAQLASIALENARLHTSLRHELAERVRAERTVQERLAFEKIVTDISTEFVNLGPDEIDAGIQHALQTIGEFAGVDRSYVFLLSGDGTTMDNTHEWCGEGIQSYIDKLKGLPVDTFPWLIQRLNRFEVVHIPHVADLPAEASAERAEFESEAIRSIILVPMIYRGALVGFLGLDAVRTEKTWDDDGIALLRIVGEVVVNALENRRAQAIQAGQRQFLELLATGGEFSRTLQALVCLIEEQWPGMMGLILLLDEDGIHLHIGAAVSLAEDYLQSIEGLEIGPMVGSCGTACYRRERVIVKDILADRRWDGLRQLAVKYGLRACWSEPVFSAGGQVLGTFAMYYRQPRAPTAAELRTIETAAHLVGIAIAHKQAQQALQAAYATLEHRVEERTRELATLNAIAAVVSRSLDLKEVLSNALDKTMEVIQMGCGGAYRLEGEGDAAYLNPLVYRGLSEEFVRFAGRLPLKGSAIEVAASSGQPLVWDVQSSPAEPDMKQALKDEGIELVVSVPLMVKGRLVGAIQMGAPEIRAFASEELSLLAAIGQQVGLAVENARLYEQAEQVAAIAERSRLARELHDSVTQSLYSVMLYAEAAARSIADREDTSASEYLRELRDTAQEALREMRLLIFELRPPALEKSGLIAALQSRLDAVEARGSIQAELTVEGECVAERLPHVVQEELYHIAQEALNNALKHSHARSVQVRVQLHDAAIRLEVCDDGVGFSLDIAKAGGGLGLRGIQERAQRIGGTCRVESAQGTGTRVIVEAPLVIPNAEQTASAAGGAK